MLHLDDPGLDATTARGLRDYQCEVDNAGSYPKQVAVGKCLFKQYNRQTDRVFKVVRKGRLRDVTRRRNAPVRRPRAGAPALINPRDEDPLGFFDLEITETFVFLPRLDLSGIDEQRAHYTIDTLKLNRDVLLAARREAYGAYRARLFEYRQRRDDGASVTALRILSHAIMTSAHPTVWREMQRQRSLVDELRDLFSDVPEALSW